MIWRDVWDGTPNVVVLAEGDVQQGVIDDALLFLGLDDLEGDVTVSDRAGRRYRLTLPDDLGDDTSTTVLTVSELSVEELNT